MFTTWFHKRTHSKKDTGFSLPELLVAMAIATSVGVISTTMLVSATSGLSKSQIATGNTARATGIIEEFERQVRSANRIVAATTTNFDYLYQRGGVCERHSVFIEPDPTNTSTYQIRRVVRAVDPPGSAGCLEAKESLIGANPVAAEANPRIEIQKLGVGSKFSYYDASGQPILVSGDTGYNPATAIPNCRLGQVQLVLDMNPVGTPEYKRVESTRIAIRSNAAGYTCSQI